MENYPSSLSKNIFCASKTPQVIPSLEIWMVVIIFTFIRKPRKPKTGSSIKKINRKLWKNFKINRVECS